MMPEPRLAPIGVATPALILVRPINIFPIARVNPGFRALTLFRAVSYSHALPG